jgi:hypothetical protein
MQLLNHTKLKCLSVPFVSTGDQMLERHELYLLQNKDAAQKERCRMLQSKVVIAQRFVAAGLSTTPWVIALALWPQSWKVSWRTIVQMCNAVGNVTVLPGHDAGLCRSNDLASDGPLFSDPRGPSVRQQLVYTGQGMI